MKKPMKAVLLSMLVFPGAGHLYVKKYVLGLLLSIGAAVATYFIVANVVQTALEVVANIQGGSIPPELGTIMELVSQQSRASEGSTNIAMIALFTFWVIGIFDLVRVRHMLEKLDREAGESKT